MTDTPTRKTKPVHKQTANTKSTRKSASTKSKKTTTAAQGKRRRSANNSPASRNRSPRIAGMRRATSKEIAQDTTIRCWGPGWDNFKDLFPAWLEARTSGGGPIYCLSNEVITSFAAPAPKGSRKRKPLFTPEVADAEHAFTELCMGYGGDVVGVWNGRPVRYGLLTEPPPPVTPEQSQEAGWYRTDLREVVAEACTLDGMPAPAPSSGAATPAAQAAELRQLEERAAAYRQETLGWVGWLMFSPRSAYREQLAELRHLDANRSSVLPWPFYPSRLNSFTLLGRKRRVGRRQSRSRRCPRLTRKQTEVLVSAVRLVWNHQWAGLATWELPEPQGVLEAVPLALAARILDPNQRVLIVPAFCNQPCADDLVQLQRRLQQTNAASCGLGHHHPIAGIAGRGASPSDYARAFQMWFLEQAARSRFVGVKLPHGFVARLSEAFRDTHHLSDERVKEIRKLYKHIFSTGQPAGRRRRR